MINVTHLISKQGSKYVLREEGEAPRVGHWELESVFKTLKSARRRVQRLWEKEYGGKGFIKRLIENL